MQIRAGRLLGEGGFAFVYEATDVATGRALCLKRMILGGNPTAEATARKEILLMSRLSGSPGIVTFFGSSLVEHGGGAGARGGCEAYIVMEYCRGGHLLNVLQRMAAENRSFQVKDAAALMSQVVEGLRVLHAQSPAIAHRDVKLENILVEDSSNGALKLCDFGSAAVGPQDVSSASSRAVQEEVIEKSTTQAYRAPEMCDLYGTPRDGQLDEAVDIWALGCVFYTMLFLVHPFQVSILSSAASIVAQSDVSTHVVLLSIKGVALIFLLLLLLYFFFFFFFFF